MHVVRRLPVALAAALVLLASCSSGGAAVDAPTPPSDGLLRVLAGSELADMGPVLDAAAAKTGVKVKFQFSGTLDGADTVASGRADQAYDAIWFSSNRYLALRPGAQSKLGTATEIMSSPVVLGLRRSVAQQLGWVGRPVTWSEIAAAAGAKKFTYGMTDPSASNSGFSTVVAVATALVGSGAALTQAQAVSTAPGLKDFFAAQTLSAGSSGYLQDAYVRRATGADPGTKVDGLINYESVLLAMNAAGNLPEPLELIYPSDGVVTAEYPLTLLSNASQRARDDYRRLTDFLRTPDEQRALMAATHRRPAVPGVPLDPAFSTAALVELPFPGQADVVDALLGSYFDKIRRPSRTLYVLDTSGSMAGSRIAGLKAAVAGLAGADSSLTGQFRRFHDREQVTLLPFSDVPAAPQVFTVSETDGTADRQRIAAAAAGLAAGGGTAIFSSLERAYTIAAQQIAADPDRFTSIVLMTDGENTAGDDIAAFRSFVAARPASVRGVPTFCVLFGEGDSGQMNEIAKLTGGKTFDGRTASLVDVFKEIRGYV